MNLKDVQKTVDQWINDVGVRYFNELTNTLLLNEEVGELSRLIARVYGEQSFKNENDQDLAKSKIEEEIADIFFVLVCLSNQMNIDLEEAFQKSLEKKTGRDLLRHKNNPKLSG